MATQQASKWWPIAPATPTRVIRHKDTPENIERVARAICRARKIHEASWPVFKDEAREFLLCFAALVDLDRSGDN